jgi:pimeloyl-[acyl-carrier protein] methyl ester esterase
MIKLVLLPGMNGTGRLFTNFIAAFQPEFEPVVANYPTDLCKNYLELEVVARSFLPRGSPFVIVAESFSGPIAITIAASSPPGLVGLVLCCTFARNPRRLIGLLKPLLHLIPFKSQILGPVNRLCLGKYSTAETRFGLRGALSLVRPEVLRHRIESVIAVDVSHKVSEIRVPILYLRATRDSLVPRSAAEHIRKLSRNVDIRDLDGPHLLLQTKPAQAAEIILEFSRRAVGSGRETSGSKIQLAE